MPARSSVVEQPALVPVVEPESTALANVPPSTGIAAMMERLALSPDVNVEKLERLIAMQERILARDAEAAFNAAFSAMQAAIPEIDEHGAILNREGAVQSRYARNEDIQKVLRPILKEHGFSIGFQTEWPDKTTVRVVGILTHRDGHQRKSEFLASADTSGAKNAIQALGSSISYGRRYTTCDLLNITSREPARSDDDGQSSEKYKQPEAPEGYMKWVAALQAAADKGTNILSAGFNDGPKEFRAHLTAHDKAKWQELKATAAKVKA